ncbi:hypothetical protein PRK78_002234 [Emydomyces testavorans]|uniref:FAS1 domain-containing protein n=1 Tax=Emydomyces testavorans TaxID=2070801 RepID=A0AAF0DFQ6_9EURO|nr:hypothetical protein PRK78_002234 [Emydomyces testavorans]
MKLQRIAFAAFLAGRVYAANFSQTISGIPELSNMSTYISQNTALQSMFDTPSNVTILAPDNAAFGDLVQVQPNGSVPLSNSSLINGILQYHILKGIFNTSNFTNTSQFIPTLLNDPTFTNVTSGQVVRAVQRDNTVHCISGLNQDAQFVGQSHSYDNGVIHIINQVLTLPQTVTFTAFEANLSSFLGAATQGNNIDAVNLPKNITVFIPTNEGFRRVGTVFSNAPAGDVSRILSYHVVRDNVIYSVGMHNQTVPTEAGKDLTLSVINGTAFVNSARIVSTDLLVNNGVVHVISDVLNPDNTTVVSSPSVIPQPVAFAGASSVSTDPFTSGQPSPTSTVTLLPASPIGATTTTTSHSTTSTSTPTMGAAPIETVNVGVAALMGLGAALINV